jgi:hypothetical protein
MEEAEFIKYLRLKIDYCSAYYRENKRKEMCRKEKNFMAEKFKNLVFYDNHRTLPSGCKQSKISQYDRQRLEQIST